MASDKYLKNIHSPADIKGMSYDQLNELAAEIRTVLIDTVSKNGGHLASNLGVVELTLAMHKEFDSPRDKFVWDVGHQAYTHKLLTGRYDRFHTLRKEGGLSGFCRPDESEHDMFYSGHSSTAASSALGLSTANTMRGSKNTVVAVVGDGSMTGGMFYEALNNAGRTHDRLIIVLNDNEMSISENVGSMARYLAVVRAKPEYYRMKAHTEKLLKHIPIIGNELSDAAFDIKSALKRIIYSDSWFEDLGLHYIGPIDGHNIQQLCEAFEMAKKYDKPVLLHVNTLKGKGYDFAERSPEQFHGISKFDINTGEPLSSGTSFSSNFGDIMCRFASCDDRVCAITAAMSIGTGLERFSNEYKYRFFDIGIAEEHAVAFALGLAKSGFIPVFAVYSTFLQRCFDQLLHDAALQKQKMVIAIDRAGFVGEDGETHQGVFDVSMLRSVPDITVYSPSSYEGLKHAMQQALYSESKLVAVRYPRGAQRAIPESIKPTFADFDVFGDENAEKAIITYGRTFSACAFAYEKLVNSGESVKLIKLNRIIPVCEGAVEAAKNCKDVYFFEEGIRRGGAGEGFLFDLSKAGFSGKYHLRAIENGFVKQASVESLLHKYGFDEEGVLSFVTSAEGLTVEENRKRIDALMVSLGVAPSREKAKEMIKSGNVYLNGKVVSKAGLLANDCDIIEYKGESERYVSRGGLKLEKAVDVFKLDLSGYLCIDIGASTGGFTDCMLQNGAKKVYAVDSGSGQLSPKLKSDPRVVDLEKTNFRYITEKEIPERADFASADVSFISLKYILPALSPLLKDGGSAVCLIKPQFEAGRENVGKKGVVKDPRVHIKVIENVCSYAVQAGFSVSALDFSPVKGPEGNIEYLVYLKKDEVQSVSAPDVAGVVSAAHACFKAGE